MGLLVSDIVSESRVQPKPELWDIRDVEFQESLMNRLNQTESVDFNSVCSL